MTFLYSICVTLMIYWIITRANVHMRAEILISASDVLRLHNPFQGKSFTVRKSIRPNQAKERMRE